MPADVMPHELYDRNAEADASLGDLAATERFSLVVLVVEMPGVARANPYNGGAVVLEPDRRALVVCLDQHVGRQGATEFGGHVGVHCVLIGLLGDRVCEVAVRDGRTGAVTAPAKGAAVQRRRESTRLNSSHSQISYAV